MPFLTLRNKFRTPRTECMIAMCYSTMVTSRRRPITEVKQQYVALREQLTQFISPHACVPREH